MMDLIMENEIDKNKSKEYFYVINYPTYEEELCNLEMKCIFNDVSKEKYIFSNNCVNPSRSPFIKEKISIIYSANTLEKIVEKIIEDKLAYEQFKVCYVKAIQNDPLSYQERLNALKEVGFVIKGYPNLQSPKVLLGVSKIGDRWIFGEYEKNDYEWHIHDEKPYSYSNGLSVRMSRAIVNIAIENNFESKLVDPCCGIGTVVIEASSLDLNIKGYEISRAIGQNAKKNLKFFGYKDVITIGNMHDIEEKFDVAIVDIPYGLFSPTTLKDQLDIIKTARKIAKKMIIITFEDMDNHIISQGFKIIDKCCVKKGNFKRYIEICK
ncbi:TRM11 family SAM-dependent methyltransferase [Clostridium senegalense]|uniref:SAM-dependent methyltransferase n=1 Tax=Clostridium senegalense TaxID=1465809 RepID=A0A6M0H6T8_9CLOT|nr:SAM-dependent methyltransferase [Clostridium senegalense]NEU06446.1 SAM-dependent methyltransferase [Clostridium senegalense]